MEKIAVEQDTIIKIEGIPFTLKKGAEIFGRTENYELSKELRKTHKSDCAVNNGPEYEPGPCDCGAE